MEVIVNADDYGMSSEINQAIQYCFEKKMIQQTSLLVNTPFADEAVNMAKQGGYANCLGLHLNLVEGRPLTEKIKHTGFCDADGTFNSSVMSVKKRLHLSREEYVAVREEVMAQIDKFAEYGCNIHHIDSHRHAHTNYPILRILMGEVRQYNCTLRLSRNIPKEAMCGVKGLYKKVINQMILSYNKKVMKRNWIEGFGSISDFDDFKAKGGNYKLVEIMIHPVMIDNKLADAINDYSVEEWKRRIT